MTGQVLSEGMLLKNGELALGRNQKLRLCRGRVQPEDAIVISEKVVRDDIFTPFTLMIIHWKLEILN
jgi:DNA-directed RNA polymerase beta subunit